MSEKRPLAHCHACNAALWGPVRYCPYCAVVQRVPKVPEMVVVVPPPLPPPLPPSPPPERRPPPEAPKPPSTPQPSPAAVAKPPTATPSKPPPPPKPRGCLAYFGYFLLALVALILYSCFKPDPLGSVEKLADKGELTAALQAWKALAPGLRVSDAGGGVRRLLQKRFVALSLRCEASCDAGCARAAASALDELATEPNDREVLAAAKRVKVVEANRQRVNAISSEVDRNLLSALAKFVAINNSTFPKACIGKSLEEKFAVGLRAACDRCRLGGDPRGCAANLLTAAAKRADDGATGVCSAIVSEAAGVPAALALPANGGLSAGTAPDPADRAAAAVKAAREANAEAIARPPPSAGVPPASIDVRPPSPSTDATTHAILKTQPSFPADARRRGITSARVMARMHINASGIVTGVIIQSAAQRSFDRAVVDSLSNWRFNPGADGRHYDTEISFVLE